MSLFGKILEKLGFGHHGAPAQPTPDAAGTSAATPGTPATTATPGATAAPAALSEVDVVSKLEAQAKTHPERLNWKTSIVDLLKLLGIESSLEARKQLATELGCPPDKMGDSAQMNIWLHQTVLRKLAENGGNVPKELLD
jgi:hypothetical protein